MASGLPDSRPNVKSRVQTTTSHDKAVTSEDDEEPLLVLHPRPLQISETDAIRKSEQSAVKQEGTIFDDVAFVQHDHSEFELFDVGVSYKSADWLRDTCIALNLIIPNDVLDGSGSWASDTRLALLAASRAPFEAVNAESQINLDYKHLAKADNTHSVHLQLPKLDLLPPNLFGAAIGVTEHQHERQAADNICLPGIQNSEKPSPDHHL